MRFIMILVIFFISIFSTTLVQSKNLNDQVPVVNIKYGSIQGISDPKTNVNYFLGIPFATPPVDSMRWKEPLDAKSWYPNILNATNFMPACPQINCSLRMPVESCPPKFSEDCLYLNVFAPKNITSPKAVMVFIHGGNFQYQGANSILLDGRSFTNLGDVIIVTIQYRLGIFGFLVTGIDDDQVKGNYGLLDQRLALRWIKTNIAAFGGDPDKITIFGQSAGAQSVAVHLLSTDIQDLFNNAILQSSPMSIPFRSFDEAMNIYAYFAEALNCKIRDVSCLRNKSVEELVEAQLAVEVKISSLKLLEFFEPWLPWLDGNLIKGQLLELEKWNLPQNFTFKPFIIGTLLEECYVYIYETFKKPISIENYGELMVAGFKKQVVNILKTYPPDLTTNDQRNLTSKVATRWVFGCSSRNFLEAVINYSSGKTSTKFYQYAFDYALDFNGWDQFTYCYNHSCHGTDVVYTFDSADANFTDVGRFVAHSHIFYWANFAKYSSPNSPISPLINKIKNNYITWTPYDLNTRPYLRFGSPTNNMLSGYIKQDCDFFDSIGYYY